MIADKIITALLITILSTSSCFAGDLPNPRLTPGDVLTIDTNIICQKGYTKTVRHVTYGMVQEVYGNYNLNYERGKRETDHLIPLELGGSNVVGNLWPQERYGTPWNAQRKDYLENKLHWMVCRGMIPLREAQYQIAHDWISAYKEYVGDE